jgi:DNA-binding beta-propeller fold protein YncE
MKTFTENPKIATNYILQSALPLRYAFILIICCFLFLLSGCASTGQSVIAAKPTGQHVWPGPPATPRIKWIRQWSNRYDYGAPSKAMEFLIGKERVETLRRPNGVVADSSGSVYVADSELHIIFVFDNEKKALRFLGLGRLSTPVGLAMNNKDGILYVSDPQQHRIFCINKNTDNVVMTIGGPTEFRRPTGLAFDEERERLYVADTQNHVVRVFKKNGSPLFTIGKRGNNDGEFNFPSYLALDKNGNLYVVDSFNFRVQVFDPDGKFLRKFGKLGDASGYFSRPAGIGVDSDGNVYVVDMAFNNFQIFDPQGRLLLWVGNGGKNAGEFYVPSGMFIDKQDRIYVSDTFNRRVQVFQYLAEKK